MDNKAVTVETHRTMAGDIVFQQVHLAPQEDIQTTTEFQNLGEMGVLPRITPDRGGEAEKVAYWFASIYDPDYKWMTHDFQVFNSVPEMIEDSNKKTSGRKTLHQKIREQLERNI